jgi:hypothetical protein
MMTTLLQKSPIDILLQQWHVLYSVGSSNTPPFAILTASEFAYVAYAQYQSASSWEPFALAAGLVAGLIPYAILQNSTNQALVAGLKAAENSKITAADETKHRELVKRWAVVNGARALLTIGAGIFAVRAILS